MDDLSLKVRSIIVSDDVSYNSDFSSINAKLSSSFGDSCSLFSDDSGSASSCHYTYTKNIASNIHPRFNLYKKTSACNQEERRRKLLLEQKKKRQHLLDESRVELSDSSVSQDTDANSEAVVSSKKSHHNKWQHSNKQYKDLLMFSEWLEEIPSDFETNWIWVMCPAGKRCLVVASEGTTTVFNKGGKFICKHSSSLPGGNRDQRIGETILDCIYDEALRTYFILDCLTWKSHPITETESEFRFYWLQYKLDENPNLNTISNENPYKFTNIPRFTDCTIESITQKLEKPFEFTLDGILFFHRESHYTSGHTPLVSWLKAYMLPEILHYPTPEWIMNTAPSDYPGARQTINQSNSEIKKFKDYLNKRTKKSLNNRLNTTPSSQVGESPDQNLEMQASTTETEELSSMDHSWSSPEHTLDQVAAE